MAGGDTTQKKITLERGSVSRPYAVLDSQGRRDPTKLEIATAVEFPAQQKRGREVGTQEKGEDVFFFLHHSQ